MKREDSTFSRREILGKAATVAAAGVAAPILKPFGKEGAKQVGANDKIVLGLIGCGGMGAANMRNFMAYPDVDVAAVCDVDSNRIPGDVKTVTEKYGREPAVFKDYRKMLERKDIDAVIIGTPDHWHALNLVHACEAGKDSYCEKPISHNIHEAVTMANCAKQHKRVVQVGTWQRSTQEFADAIAYVRSGKFGKVVLTRAWITDTFQAGRQNPVAVPNGLDYDFWVGPAKFEPYQSNRCHYNWRWFMNYGGGLSTDWGVHMMDIAMLGMSKDQDLHMPVSCAASGGQYAFTNDDRTAPDTMEAVYQFENPGYAMHWSICRDHPDKPGHGTEFVSADGKTVRVWRGGWKVLNPEGKELPKESTAPVGDHWRNFLDCVKSRGKPRADLASIVQTTIVCHLSNCALESGETVHWDNEKMDISGKAGKDSMAYRREYRKPWALPKYR